MERSEIVRWIDDNLGGAEHGFIDELLKKAEAAGAEWEPESELPDRLNLFALPLSWPVMVPYERGPQTVSAGFAHVYYTEAVRRFNSWPALRALAVSARDSADASQLRNILAGLTGCTEAVAEDVAAAEATGVKWDPDESVVDRESRSLRADLLTGAQLLREYVAGHSPLQHGYAEMMHSLLGIADRLYAAGAGDITTSP